MKTAEEWVNDAEGKWDVEYVKAIQADALRHAADIMIADWVIRGDDCSVRNSIRFIRTFASTLNQ